MVASRGRGVHSSFGGQSSRLIDPIAEIRSCSVNTDVPLGPGLPRSAAQVGDQLVVVVGGIIYVLEYNPDGIEEELGIRERHRLELELTDQFSRGADRLPEAPFNLIADPFEVDPTAIDPSPEGRLEPRRNASVKSLVINDLAVGTTRHGLLLFAAA
jgi:hypothetical protein